MKKLLAIFTLCAGLSTCMIAHADGWHHGGGHYVYRPGFGWVVPSVIGGVIGYELARPVQPNVVIVQPTPVAPPPAAPVMPQPAGYHWEAILDASCNCYRTVLVPN
jgi:hypothetical protein